MDTIETLVSQRTVEMIAESFYREAHAYGFGMQDYLRFVNVVLAKTSLEGEPSPNGSGESSNDALDPASFVGRRLPLVGPRIVVREFDPARDASLMRGWLADHDGRHFLLSRSTARPLDLDTLVDGGGNVLGVIALPDGRAIGAVAFLDHDAEQGRAELRKLIGEADMRRRGYAKEATRLWIGYGVGALGIRKIYLNTLGTNLRNIRLNEELGFKVEGILRSELLVDGRAHDVVRMALLARDLTDGATERAAEASVDADGAAAVSDGTRLVSAGR